MLKLGLSPHLMLDRLWVLVFLIRSSSYTYINSGFNVRYNHSEKFGLGGGTSYSHRFYQTDRTLMTA